MNFDDGDDGLVASADYDAPCDCPTFYESWLFASPDDPPIEGNCFYGGPRVPVAEIIRWDQYSNEWRAILRLVPHRHTFHQELRWIDSDCVPTDPPDLTDPGWKVTRRTA